MKSHPQCQYCVVDRKCLCAGDLAAAELGQVAKISSDLIHYLPHAWKQVT